MSKEDFTAKMKQLKISHFVQCIDLTNAYNGDETSDEERKQQREMISEFVDRCPEGSFVDFCVCLGRFMVGEGHISEQQFRDILDGKDIDA